MASQQEIQVLEMLIGVWRGMTQRAHDRAEQADVKQEGPSADYWRGFASALELAIEQLSTSMANLPRSNELERETQPADGSRQETDRASAEGLLQAIPLEDRARRLLSAIRSQDEQWLKRTDIAHLLGNKMLSSGDMVLLRSLVEQGYIETRQVSTTAPSGIRWEYRVH